MFSMKELKIKYRDFVVMPEGYIDSPWFVIVRKDGRDIVNPEGMKISKDVIYTEDCNVENVFRYIDRVYYGAFGGL